MSLDGVIEAPGAGEAFGHGDRAIEFDRGPEGNQFKLDELQKAEAGGHPAWLRSNSRTDQRGGLSGRLSDANPGG
jgi:hypothetical protein